MRWQKTEVLQGYKQKVTFTLTSSGDLYKKVSFWGMHGRSDTPWVRLAGKHDVAQLDARLRLEGFVMVSKKERKDDILLQNPARARPRS